MPRASEHFPAQNGDLPSTSLCLAFYVSSRTQAQSVNPHHALALYLGVATEIQDALLNARRGVVSSL